MVYKKDNLSHLHYSLFSKAGKYEIHFKEVYLREISVPSFDFRGLQALLIWNTTFSAKVKKNEVLLYLENKESVTFVNDVIFKIC